MSLNEDREKLEKAVKINLGCVTVSSKGGVPLENLQGDYQSLIGTSIPYVALGYESLESFIHSIPDVIHLKRNKGQLIAEAVPDPTTAHIANLISKQKSTKKLGKKYVPMHVSKKVQHTVKKSTVSSSKPSSSSSGLPSKTPLQKQSQISRRFLATSYLSNWCNRSNIQPNYKYREKRSKQDFGFLCEVNIPGFDYIGVGKASNKKDARNNASKDFLCFLIYAGRLSQNKVPIDFFVPVSEDEKNLKKTVIINLLSVVMRSKNGVPLENLQSEYLNCNNTPIQFEAFGYSSLANFIRSLPGIITREKNNGQLLIQGVPGVTSDDIANLISKQKPLKKCSVENPVQPSTSSKNVSDASIKKETQQKISSKCKTEIPLLMTDKNPSDFSTENGPPEWSGKSLRHFPSIATNIRKVRFSTLLGLHNLLFRIPYTDSLQDKILSFAGYLFPKGSEDWKKREFLLSVLPSSGVREYLNLLCIKHSDKEDRHILLDKLMQFLASPKEELIDSGRNIGRKLSDIDFYEECQVKDKLLAKFLTENNLLKEMLKMKDSDKCIELSSEVNNLRSEVQKLKEELDKSQSDLKKAEEQRQTLSWNISILQQALNRTKKGLLK